VETQTVVRVHCALPSGAQCVHSAAYALGEGGVPELPFVSLDGNVFLREFGTGELISFAFVHRIEGLPDPKDG
jgi:hypothetical protein